MPERVVVSEEVLERRLWYYRAQVLDVFDGDTFLALVDLGFRVHVRAKVRLARADAPALTRKGKGKLAREFLQRLVLGKRVYLFSYGYGRYNRWVCEVWAQTGEGDWVNVADALVAAKLADRRDVEAYAP